MVQEFHVLRCFSCQTFQVQQVKKSKKWACKVCGEKQSVIKEYGRGSAADCRRHVQKLNSLRGELLEVNSERVLSQWEQDEENQNESVNEDLDSNYKSEEVNAVSRWSKYIDQTAEGPQQDDEEEEENIYTERERFRNQGTRKRKSFDGPYGNSKGEESWADCRGVKKRPYQHDGKLSSSWNKGYFSKYSCRSAEDVSCTSAQLPSSPRAVSSFHTASTSYTCTVANSSKGQLNSPHNQPRAEVTKHLPLSNKGPSVPSFCQKSVESQLESKDSKWNKFLTIVPSEEEDVGDFHAHHLSPTCVNTVVLESSEAVADLHSEEHGCPLAKTNIGVLGRQKSVSKICVDGNSYHQTNSHTFTSKPAGFEKPACNQPPLTKTLCPSLSLNSLFFTDEDFDDIF